eukprot:5902754-Pyramimonas_sp.AAC.1
MLHVRTVPSLLPSLNVLVDPLDLRLEPLVTSTLTRLTSILTPLTSISTPFTGHAGQVASGHRRHGAAHPGRRRQLAQADWVRARGGGGGGSGVRHLGPFRVDRRREVNSTNSTHLPSFRGATWGWGGGRV